MRCIIRYTCYIIWGHTAKGEGLSRFAEENMVVVVAVVEAVSPVVYDVTPHASCAFGDLDRSSAQEKNSVTH